jgi:hypothetical protein
MQEKRRHLAFERFDTGSLKRLGKLGGFIVKP